MCSQKCCCRLCSPQWRSDVNGRIWVMDVWWLYGLKLYILKGSLTVIVVQLLGCRRTPRVGYCFSDFRIVKSYICIQFILCKEKDYPDHKGAFLSGNHVSNWGKPCEKLLFSSNKLAIFVDPVPIKLNVLKILGIYMWLTSPLCF